MNFIERSDHMKDQWSKPKPKPRFKHIQSVSFIYKVNKPHWSTKPKILECKWFIYKVQKTAFNNLVIISIENVLKLWIRIITSLL